MNAAQMLGFCFFLSVGFGALGVVSALVLDQPKTPWSRHRKIWAWTYEVSPIFVFALTGAQVLMYFLAKGEHLI